MNAAVDWMRYQLGTNTAPYLSAAELQSAPSPAQTPRTSTTRPQDIAPTWQPFVIDRLLNLVQIGENWDSYGAKAPSKTSANELLNVLTAVMNSDTPAPSVVPSPLGHFQAEWHRNGVDLEVEVVAPTQVFVSFSDAQGGWEDKLDFDFTRLVQAIRRVGPTA
jgi:hypothetical protein